MTPGPACLGRPLRGSGRGTLLLGVIALTLSLLAPLALPTDLAVARGEKACPEGQILDPRQGCVDSPATGQPEEQEPGTCPDGETFDETRQQCVGEPPASVEKPVTIQLALRLCPGEVKAVDLGLDGLIRQCPDNPDPVTVVHGGDGIREERQQVVGNARWSGPAGSHYLTAIAPDGFGRPRVFCGLVDPKTGRPDLREVRIDTSGAARLKLDSGQAAQCLWFDLAPEPAGKETGVNQIDVIAHACPAGLPAMTSVDEYRKACTPDDGWEFTLTTPGGPQDPVATDAKGHAGWAQMPSGTWRLQEALPGHFGDPIVFCRWTNWPSGVWLNGNWEQVPAPGGLVPGRFDGAPYRIECFWFNHEPPASVEKGNTYALVKYTCPEGIGPGESLETYRQACTAPASGVDFEIAYDDMVVSATTDGGGELEISGIPYGEWQVTEIMPEGYGDPMVWCRYTDWPDDVTLRDDWFQKSAPGGRMTGSFDVDGARFACDWFNIHEREAESAIGAIEIFKLWCPYGTSGSGGIVSLRDQCSFQDIPVEITLTIGTTEMRATAIGATPAEWTDVAGQDFSMQEAVPSGWEVLTVWCQVSADGTFLDPRELPDNDGEVDLTSPDSGMTMSCAYFNVSTDPVPTEVTD